MYKNEPEIRYKIIYLAIYEKDVYILISFIEKNYYLFNNSCNSLLIRSEWKNIKLLKQILQLLKNTNIYKTLYVSEKVDAYHFSDDYDLQKIVFNEHIEYYDPFPVQNESFSNYLTCTSWFQYFLGTLFQCGKGRLKQLSGTCYLNAVVNMIILTKLFKRICVQAMNNFVKNHPQYAPEIKKDLTEDFCPTLSIKTNLLRTIKIFQYLYHILCNSSFPQKIKQKNIDVFIEASRKLFSSNQKHFFRPSLIKKINAGEGGLSSFVLYSFLINSGINFAYCYYDMNLYETNYLYLQFPVPLKNEAEIQKLKAGDLNHLFLAQNEIVSLAPHSFEVILLLTNEDNKNILSDMKKMYKHHNFFPESCNISIRFEEGDAAHGITGFYCNKEFKIYDSNNHIYNFNWAKTDLSELIPVLEEKYGKVKFVFIRNVIFVNMAFKTKYQYVTCDF